VNHTGKRTAGVAEPFRDISSVNQRFQDQSSAADLISYSGALLVQLIFRLAISVAYWIQVSGLLTPGIVAPVPEE
jgi:hypothetical protein